MCNVLTTLAYPARPIRLVISFSHAYDKSLLKKKKKKKKSQYSTSQNPWVSPVALIALSQNLSRQLSSLSGSMAAPK